MKKGLVSVTFRALSPEKIADLCVENSLEYIEWGGDIHVPPTDPENARSVRTLCLERGLKPLGYGSYYNAADDIDKFLPNLDTACVLGTEYIRIWAGKSAVYDEAAAENIHRAVLLAKERGMSVTLECHRGTMTENCEFAARLARETGCLLHFQPNPDLTFEQNLRAVRETQPYLSACHVFAWEKGNVRFPLETQRRQWSGYAEVAGDVPYLLEFVANDDPVNLVADAAELAYLERLISKN